MKRLDVKPYDAHVFVCQGSKCGKHGGKEIYKESRREMKDRELPVHISRADCFGKRKHACVVVLEGPVSRWWGKVKPKHVEKIAQKVAEKLLEKGEIPLH